MSRSAGLLCNSCGHEYVNNYPIISHTYSIVTVMVSVFISDVVDRGFEPRSGQTTD